MSSINLGVGDDVDFETEWLQDNTPLTSGTASLTGIQTLENGDELYVQSDLTLDAAPYSFAMSLNGTSWRYPMAVPDDWDGRVIKFTRVHSDPDVYPGVTNIRVGLIAGGTVTNPIPGARFD